MLRWLSAECWVLTSGLTWVPEYPCWFALDDLEAKTWSRGKGEGRRWIAATTVTSNERLPRRWQVTKKHEPGTQSRIANIDLATTGSEIL
jgi:hypothetical protein